MQFTKVIVAAAAVAVANATVEFTDPTFAGITVGTPFNITWSGAEGPVTLSLKDGLTTNLQLVSTIATSVPVTTSFFIWTPSASLSSNTYAIEIDDGVQDPNFSTQFQLLGASAASSSLSSSAPPSLSSSTASLSSSTSSLISSIVANSTTSSASASTTPNSNSTSTSKSASTASKTSSSASSSTSGANTVPSSSTSSAAGIASPLAMVFLALAAFVSLN